VKTLAPYAFTALLLSGLAGCDNSPAPSAPTTTPRPNAPAAASDRVAPGGSVTIRVDASGYHPSRVTATAGSEITLSFLRTTTEGCGEQVKIPSLSITRELPVNVAVAIPVRVPASGQLGFTCGMDMYRGAVVVQ
jgi:plastocyanin domain-containing protein